MTFTRKDAGYVVVIVVLLAIIVGVYAAIPCCDKVQEMQENTITVSPVATTTTPKVVVVTKICIDDESVPFTDVPWGTLWSLDENQMMQLQFFDSCKYRNFSAWRIADYEGIMDAKIKAYRISSSKEVVIKNWSFKKILYFDRGVKIFNNTVISPYSEGITPYIQVVENPMETDEEIYIYYFNDNSKGVVAIAVGYKETAVLKKYDAGSDSDSTNYGGGENTGGGPTDDQVSDYPEGPVDDPISDYPTGPIDNPV